MAFSFGAAAPAPAGGLFGAPAASAPSFGAAAPAAAPSFGAPAAGGLFGAAPAAAPAFGAAAPAPAAGGLFGAPAASAAPAAGGLFGAAAPAPAGGLFGAAPAAAPAAAGGLFGAAPKPATSLFGAAPATAPAAGGLFGGAAATPGFGAAATLGGAAAAAPPGGLTAPSGPRPRDLGADRAVHDLATAIAERLPNGQPNPDARLVTVVYDMADGAASAAALQHARPPHVSPELWAKFARENPDPDRCVPAALVGFEALAARVAGAQAAVERNGAFAAKIGHKAELLVRAAKLNDALGEELRSRNAALSLRLLRVAKKVEVVKRENVPVHGEERRLAARLRRLEQEAAKPARHLEALKRDAARLDADARADAKARVAEDDKAAVMAALEAQHAGLAKLVDVVHADLRDVEIMRNLLKPK